MRATAYLKASPTLLEHHLLQWQYMCINIIVLVGFGRACASVRCAHPSFLTHCHLKRGAARPSPPIAASLLLIRPLKIFTIYRTWAAHVKGFFLSTGPQRLWGPLPPVPPRPAIFWGQKYIPVRPLIFSVFLFFSCWIFSFRYSLFFLISFSISSYSSLLISFYSSRRAIIRLLILLLLYFQLFVV